MVYSYIVLKVKVAMFYGNSLPMCGRQVPRQEPVRVRLQPALALGLRGGARRARDERRGVRGARPPRAPAPRGPRARRPALPLAGRARAHRKPLRAPGGRRGRAGGGRRRGRRRRAVSEAVRVPPAADGRAEREQRDARLPDDDARAERRRTAHGDARRRGRRRELLRARPR